MNRPPHHLADHAGDELLSAHLDDAVEGEERVALEEHLDACDPCQARLARLGAHSSDLRVEPLDEVTRRRLVGTALSAFDDRVVAPRHRPPAWWQSPRLLAAAMVALLLAIGLTTVLSQGGDDADSVASRAEGGDASAIPEDVIIGDIGTFDDPATLRNSLGAELHTATGGRAAGDSAASSDSGDASGTAEGDTSGTAEEGADEFDGSDAPAAESPQPMEAAPTADGRSSQPSPDPDARSDAERCLGALGDAMPADAEITLVATGTFQDRPAVALVFESDGRFAAFVAARDDCAILAFQSFPG